MFWVCYCRCFPSLVFLPREVPLAFVVKLVWWVYTEHYIRSGYLRLCSYKAIRVTKALRVLDLRQLQKHKWDIVRLRNVCMIM